MSKVQEIKKLKFIVTHLKEMPALQACAAINTLAMSSLPSCQLIDMQFMNAYRKAVKMWDIETHGTDEEWSFSFRACQNSQRILELFSSYVESAVDARQTRTLEAVEGLILQIVSILNIPAEVAQEIADAEKKLETMATINIMEAVCNARAGGVPEKDIMELCKMIDPTSSFLKQ